MLERVYLVNYVLQSVHILSESFNGVPECINVSKQILQSLHGLKGKKRGKCKVWCGWGKRYIKCRNSLLLAMIQEVLLALPRPGLEHAQRPANDTKVNAEISGDLGGKETTLHLNAFINQESHYETCQDFQWE